MKNLDPKRSRWIRVRMALLVVLLLCGVLAIGKRAWELQITRSTALKEMADKQYFRNLRVAAHRGTIYDCNGAELAVSVDVDSVWANPRAMRRAGVLPGRIAQELAPLLGIDAQTLFNKLSLDRYFVWLRRHVSADQARAIAAKHFVGVELAQEPRRYYPNRGLGAHVLGFANVDGVGIEGLELAFEKELRGSATSMYAMLDRRGQVVFSEQLLDAQANVGSDLVLTLDKTLQYVVEQELAMATRAFEARSASVVMVEPKTGEILALANYPTYNPNEPAKATPFERRNRALTDRFEPGSTMKPFAIAGALATGAVGPADVIDCGNGSMKFADHTIHDTTPWSVLSVEQVLAKSSNVGAARIAASLGREGLFRTLHRFGFGERTGLSFPGETEGILRHYKKWYEMDVATISFGQGMSVTAVQLAYAMGALANGGKLMRPILIKRVVKDQGRTVIETAPEVRRQVLPIDVAQRVANMLVSVTAAEGTGVEAAIAGFRVAGKTGTAQKADYVRGGYADNQWVASFVGFAPANDPKFVMAVIVDEPALMHYGGTVAGSIFRRIGERTLRHLGVSPPGANPSLWASVLSKFPRTLDKEHKASRLKKDKNATKTASTAGEGMMPDVLAMDLRQALVTLQKSGLYPHVQGVGWVVAQEPEAGAPSVRGQRVTLTLAEFVYSDSLREKKAPVVNTPEDASAIVQLAKAGGVGAAP